MTGGAWGGSGGTASGRKVSAAGDGVAEDDAIRVRGGGGVWISGTGARRARSSKSLSCWARAFSSPCSRSCRALSRASSACSNSFMRVLPALVTRAFGDQTRNPAPAQAGEPLASAAAGPRPIVRPQSCPKRNALPNHAQSTSKASSRTAKRRAICVAAARPATSARRVPLRVVEAGGKGLFEGLPNPSRSLPPATWFDTAVFMSRG